MAFGGGSSFQFGQNNQSSGFSGFGSNNNNNQASGTGFGQSGSAFGGGAQPSGGFGASGSAFGASSGGAFGGNNNAGSSLFGAKPATGGFGSSTTGGGLFGNTSNTTTTGGFGASTPAFGGSNNTTSAFGGGASTTGNAFGGGGLGGSGGAFGAQQNKPSLFGAGGTGTTGAFGSGNAFGGSGTALGGAVPPSSGTADPQFQPLSEKEATGTVVNYQTISMMQPYQKYSLEELRLADYEKGRQFGNGSGGAGAFGQTNFGNTNIGSAFGGGGTTGGLFGSTSTSGTAFGSNTATTGGFGANASSGGLFGNQQNKPATGGLFGQQSSGTTSGGLFGTSNSTPSTGFGGGAFGQNNQQSTPSSGGLFGSNNTTQNKPGGLFGGGAASTTNTGTGFSFGQNNTQQSTPTSGGLFGGNNATSNTTGGGLFGGQNNQQASTTGGGLFGSTSNNQQQGGGGLFGNKTGGFGTNTTQPQPSGGLFGGGANTNTGGGLFGNNNQQQQSSGGGLFGNANNTQQSNTTGGGLFGSTQNKPGGLFGGGASTNTSGGGLFGGNNNQQQQSGGLFGGANSQQQQSGGLFGGGASTNTGGGLFGGQQNKPATGGLFGTSTNNTQQGGLFGNSMNQGGLFNQSQTNQQQQNPMQQEVKHASLLDPNPYGQSSIWTGLPAPNEQNSKPVFTPLTATRKLEESKLKPLPSLRLNQSRYNTPPRRQGYGLSYSTYGTPNSAASTPGAAPLSASMYCNRGWSGGSFGRSFNRSASVQNLRSQYASDSDDIWKPNAFTPSHRNSSGSIKRLTIDRSIRQDLFNRPAPVPALPAPRQPTNGESNAPVAQITDGNEPAKKLNKRVSFENTAQESQLNGETGALTRVEDDSDDSPPQRNSNGKNSLQAVPEDHESHQVSNKPAKANAKPDPTPGEYWMKPTRQEQARMDKNVLRSYKGFEVGRQGCGYVTFDGTVDLTALDLDNLFEHIVEIRVRSVTVYPDTTMKPPVGRGLNVPSTIVIENSWPRAKNRPVSDTQGPIFEKHIKRLQRMDGTDFVNYDEKTGAWTFRVPHYTRYGLDYDEDDESMMDQSELSLPPQSLDKSADASVMEVDDQSESDDNDDTFAFKQSVPGQFGRQSVIPAEEDTEVRSDEADERYDDSSEQSAHSEDDMMSEEEQSPPMPGSLPPNGPFLFSPQKSPTKAVPGTPGKPLLDLDGDWAEQLQRTISPRKQNRDVLREAQSKVLLDQAFSPIKPKAAPQVNFRSSIDIMNSMFKPAASRKSNKDTEPDFEFPYSKRSKIFHPDDEEMTESDRQWHHSFKPSFTSDGRFIHRVTKPSNTEGWKEVPVAGDRGGIVVLGSETVKTAFDLDSALASSEVKLSKNVPTVRHRAMPFSQLKSTRKDKEVAMAYELAHVLFDTYEDEFTFGLTGPQQKEYLHRIRRDRLTSFIAERVSPHIKSDDRDNSLRAAVLRLTAHDITGACELLKQDKNYRISLLVSQLDGADQSFMDDTKAQIDAWREQKSLSEFDLDMRTLFELCAGNVTISKGREGKNVPVEDRAETFNISGRYGLDWLQCFALGLFYGKQEKNNGEDIARIEDAVREYQARCDRGEEPVKPSADDTMWNLLKLYAAAKTDGVQAPSFPAALEGLAKSRDQGEVFTFYNTITTNMTVETDTVRADELTETLASELSSRGDIAGAIFVLLHLLDTNIRSTQIQSLLDRFAGQLPGPDTVTSDAGIQLWQRLTMDLKVPHIWIFMSKARYAAAPSASNNGGDNISELRYLVAAESWDDAHECLLRRVVPAFIIDEDWEELLALIKLFGDEPARKVEGWYDGGDIFATYSKLMTNTIAKQDAQVITSLRKRIVAMGNKAARDTNTQSLGKMSRHELEEHVAVKEMANGLAKLALRGGIVGTLDEILELPLTQDVRDEIKLAMGVAGNDDQVLAKPKGRTRSQQRGLRIQDDQDQDMEGNGHGA